MSLYAILLNAPDEGAWEKVRAQWPQHFILDDRVAFVSAENVLTADVARDAGIGASGANGLAIQLDFFSGHTSGSLAEWISKNGD